MLLLLIIIFISSASHLTMGNGTSRPQLTLYQKRNILRNEKAVPKDIVRFKDALQKDKHWNVLSKKDCSVAKPNLARGNHIRYCCLPSALEPEQEQFSVQNWEMRSLAFVKESNL